MKKISGDLNSIKKSVLVKDVMSKDVLTLDEKDTVQKAMETMSEHSFSSIVVMNDNLPAGILTERDLLNRVFLKNKKPKKTHLRQVMSKDPVTISPDVPIAKAAKIMKDKKIKKLLVTKDDKITGIITQTDIITNMNMIYRTYKSLLWNPWFSIVMFLLITALFLLNIIVFRT